MFTCLQCLKHAWVIKTIVRDTRLTRVFFTLVCKYSKSWHRAEKHIREAFGLAHALSCSIPWFAVFTNSSEKPLVSLLWRILLFLHANHRQHFSTPGLGAWPNFTRPESKRRVLRIKVLVIVHYTFGYTALYVYFILWQSYSLHSEAKNSTLLKLTRWMSRCEFDCVSFFSFTFIFKRDVTGSYLYNTELILVRKC